jgi:hypothetical protein
VLDKLVADRRPGPAQDAAAGSLSVGGLFGEQMVDRRVQPVLEFKPGVSKINARYLRLSFVELRGLEPLTPTLPV